MIEAVEVPSAVEILRRFRSEKTDPEPFYVGLADRTMASFRFELEGRRVLDLGCGPGWYSVAMRRAGADVVGLDFDPSDVRSAHERLGTVLRGDAMNIGLPDSSVDGVFCSNLLEHLPDQAAVIDEIARVTRPGGWGYISWTPWFSPWGGHEIVPFHLLGTERGPRLYEKFRGRPRKNVPGEGLFPTKVGEVLRLVKNHPGLDVIVVEPRYYPQLKAIAKVPGLREFALWNCAISVRVR